jgi:adenylate cyclase
MIVAGLLPILLVALLKLLDLPGFGQVTNLIFDSYQRTYPREYVDAGVRVVDIDDETIRRFGQWPWPRTDIAALTQAIADAGAAAIAFDIVFSEPDRTSPAILAERAARQGATPEQVATLRGLPDHDAQFAAALSRTPSVLGLFLTRGDHRIRVQPKAGFAVAGSHPGASIIRFSSAVVPLPAFEAAAQGLGSVSILGDGDGIVRRPPLVAELNGMLLPALSVEALRVAQGAGAIIIRSSDASGEVNSGAPETVGLKIGEFEVPVTERGELWMHYTREVPERTVAAWQILSGTLPPAEMERLFAGRIVFIGAGAIGLRDLVSTPVVERELGVTVHAQAVEQMVLSQFLHRPDWVNGLEMAVLVIAGLVLASVLPRMGALGGALVGGGLVALVVGGSWYAFRYHSLLVDPAAPSLALLATYVVVSLFTYVREERQRLYIHRAFDRYLSPELVKRITDDPGQLELGGEERPMTVLFSDIRSFSRISEQLTPQQIIRFMIAFLTPMTDILLARKATIDKYIGDAILAFWNAPLDDEDQYRNAALGALDMMSRLRALNDEMAAQTKVPWPGRVEIGIGLNAGRCCVGNMGSAQRLSYSLIGDTVNLASRIEGLTKQYGVCIALGSELAEKIPEFALIELDRVRVVGRERPATVHALVGDEAFARTPDFVAFREEHEAMLAAYRARRWDEAQARLEAQRAAAGEFGVAKLYDMYFALVRTYVEDPPPPEWDGTWSAKTK